MGRHIEFKVSVDESDELGNTPMLNCKLLLSKRLSAWLRLIPRGRRRQNRHSESFALERRIARTSNKKKQDELPALAGISQRLEVYPVSVGLRRGDPEGPGWEDGAGHSGEVPDV